MTFVDLKKSPIMGEIKEFLDGFFYGYTYPILLSLVAMISFCFNVGLLGFTIFAVLASINLLLYKDLTPFISPVCLFLFCFNDLNVINCLYFYLLCVFLAICLIAHFFIHKTEFYIGNL